MVACLEKKKTEKKDDKKGGKTDQTVKKTPSQERRDNSATNKRDLSQPRSNRSPPRFGAPCAQVRVCEKGDTPPENNSDSDEEEEYDTPPETLDFDDNLEEEKDDPNAPERSDDDMSENEENETRPDTADLLDLEQIRLEHNYSLSTTKSCVSSIPTSSSSKNWSNDGLWPRSNTPPCDKPPDPEFDPKIQQKLIPIVKNPEEKIEEDPDPIEDMGRYIHTILDSDDEDEKQCKKDYNTALAMYTKVQLIHDDKKKEEDLENEESFEEIWNLSKRDEEDSSVKDLCESLEKLNIDENQESENSDSSTNP